MVLSSSQQCCYLSLLLPFSCSPHSLQYSLYPFHPLNPSQPSFPLLLCFMCSLGLVYCQEARLPENSSGRYSDRNYSERPRKVYIYITVVLHVLHHSAYLCSIRLSLCPERQLRRQTRSSESFVLAVWFFQQISENSCTRTKFHWSRRAREGRFLGIYGYPSS